MEKSMTEINGSVENFKLITTRYEQELRKFRRAVIQQAKNADVIELAKMVRRYERVLFSIAAATALTAPELRAAAAEAVKDREDS
jgi:beta-galactosidase GanA